MYEPQIPEDFLNEEKMFNQSNPKPKPQSIEEYEDDVNPKLKKYGKKVVDLRMYSLLKISLIFLIFFFAAFIFMVSKDKFKSEINIPECPIVNIPACPEISIPACPIVNIPACNCPSGNVSLSCGDVLWGNSSG